MIHHNCICEEGNMPSSPNNIDILLMQIKREVEELVKTTEAKLLCHDGKIAELQNYVKDNLSSTIRVLLDDMKFSGELDNLILDSIRPLLVGTTISVKEFGAIGNGTVDDTVAFLRAYECANTSKDKLPCVKIPAGIYRISQTIEIPSYIKTIIEGNVVLLSDVKDGATLHITSGDKATITDELKYVANNSFVDGAFISGGNLIIQRSNSVGDINSTNESIGLLIGDEIADKNKIPVSRCSFNNISITGFKKALAINPVNTYLLTFNHLHTENDYYGVYIGGENRVNSGENISFNNCIFSHHYHAIFNDYENMAGINFNQCSFDFNSNNILQNKEGNVLYNLNGCHFEGVGFVDSVIKADSSNTPGFSTIFHRNNTNKYSKSLCVLDNCFIHLNTFNPGNKLFTALASGGKHSFIQLKNCGLSWENSKLTFDNRFMADDNTEIELSAPRIATDFIPYLGSNNDKFGKYSNIQNSLSGDYSKSDFKETFDKTGYLISANTWSSTPVNVSVNTSNKLFDKSIVVEQNSYNGYCQLMREIDNLNKSYIASSCYVQGGNITLEDTTIGQYDEVAEIMYRFYDKNDNLIEEKKIPGDTYHYKKGDWICMTTFAKIPVGACKARVYANYMVKKNGTILNYKGSVLYGGHIVELMD